MYFDMNDNNQLLQVLENPEIFKINRLPAHSSHRYYPTLELAQVGGAMPWRKCLNGTWQFLYSETLADRPLGFEGTDFDTTTFNQIEVPGHIQLQGYGRPQYTNIAYPWDGIEKVTQPQIPKIFNPTASYVRNFTVPTDWIDGVFISFQGVETAFNVWVNGQFVGYSEDSFTPSAFDLTPFIDKNGENKLAVQVYQFASASWLEDQDFWRMSGIFRDVYLYTKPATHIEDFFTKTLLNDKYSRAKVITDFKVTGMDEATIEARLLDNEGDVVAIGNIQTAAGAANLMLEVEKPKLWSAEHPYLYSLEILLKQDDILVEAICQPVGIREFKMDNKIMKINGQRIVFRGVNRHEFSATRGRSITRADMEWDIKFMKAHNLNAVRTSHYPNDVYFYELCDKYGLYVIDEANIETHGSWNYSEETDFSAYVPHDHPEWLAPVIDRAENVFARDKNHPSVIIWSCGNEAHGGEVLFKMAEYFRAQDETRLVHYEGIFWDRRYNDTSDMESQMYSKVATIREYLEKDPQKPFILCEYSHAMSNSCGGLNRYIELEEYEMYQGGFIWDFIDQTLVKTDRYGQEFLAYGGDFDDRPSDYNFCTNGIVDSLRQPTTKALAVKGAYQPFGLTIQNGEVTIFNKHNFTNLNQYIVRWTVQRSEIPAEAGELVLDLEPLATTMFKIPVDITPGSEEIVLKLSIQMPNATDYSDVNHEVAFVQEIINPVLVPKQERPIKPFRMADCKYNVGIHGENFSVMFSRKSGQLTSLKYDDNEYIYHPEQTLKPSFWRAPVDNDRGSNAHVRMVQWKIATLYAQCVEQNYEWTENGLRATLKYNHHTTPISKSIVVYFVDSHGRIDVTLKYEGFSDLPDMFKFGMDFSIPADFNQLKWRGFGPDETYADREFGATYGTFNNMVSENVPGYVMPQACGNHTGVRYAEITNRDGQGLRIKTEPTQPLSFSALPYSAHELELATHKYDLPVVHKTVLSINLKEMGVGGDDSWGARPEAMFDIPADQPYELKFQIEPVE